MKIKFFITYIALVSIINCGLSDKKRYITNFNGVVVSKINSEEVISLSFGQEIFIKEKLNSNDSWKAYVTRGDYFRISESDFAEKLPEYIYNKKVQGLKLDSEQILPIMEKVKLVSLEKVNGKTLIKFKYNEKEFSSSSEDFSSKIPALYFFVTENSGLNLREGAGQSFKKILTLPLNSKGKILSANPEVFTIQKQKGFWMRVQYEDKIGWLFSGFVILTEDQNWEPPYNITSMTSTVENDTSGDDYTFLEFKDHLGTASSKIEPQYSYQKTKIQFEPSKINPNDSSECAMSSQFLRIKSVNWDYTIGLYDMELSKKESIKAGFIFYSGRVCNCCCATSESNLLAITNDAPKYFKYEESAEAYCSTREVSYLVPISYNQYRIDPSKNTLFILRELPICAKKQEEENIDTYNKFEKIGSKGYFYIFQIDNGILKQEKLETEPNLVPETWKQKWEAATPLL
ncbi:MAG: SH3 domain-containing protein [Leptospiraceae bacterium]|nr:SH3 domain-containing protein [Leptospiraceae bacterium]